MQPLSHIFLFGFLINATPFVAFLRAAVIRRDRSRPPFVRRRLHSFEVAFIRLYSFLFHFEVFVIKKVAIGCVFFAFSVFFYADESEAIKQN